MAVQTIPSALLPWRRWTEANGSTFWLLELGPVRYTLQRSGDGSWFRLMRGVGADGPDLIEAFGEHAGIEVAEVIVRAEMDAAMTAWKEASATAAAVPDGVRSSPFAAPDRGPFVLYGIGAAGDEQVIGRFEDEDAARTFSRRNIFGVPWDRTRIADEPEHT